MEIQLLNSLQIIFSELKNIFLNYGRRNPKNYYITKIIY